MVVRTRQSYGHLQIPCCVVWLCQLTIHVALCHLTAEKTTTASDILTNLYVDNIVSGCSSETRALDYYKEARILMSKAKLKLRNWASNSTKLTAMAQ